MDKEIRFIGVNEAAQLLNVTTQTIRRRIYRGEFATVTKLPGTRAPYVLDRAEVEAKAAA